MHREIHIEQTADGRWTLVAETPQGQRELVGTFDTYEAAAGAADGAP